jgi:hypothetical protein
MATRIQSSELAWFNAVFIATAYSTLACESRAFFGGNDNAIPQGLRYQLP